MYIMEEYDISPYSFHKASMLGVIIKPSVKRNYKLDVFSEKDNKYITSVGDRRYMDYPSYYKSEGREYAENRRRLYMIRHKKDLEKIGSRGFYAFKLLW
jgi:hypothetical protein